MKSDLGSAGAVALAAADGVLSKGDDSPSFDISGVSGLGVFSKLGAEMGEEASTIFLAVGAGVSKALPGEPYAGGSSSVWACKDEMSIFEEAFFKVQRTGSLEIPAAGRYVTRIFRSWIADLGAFSNCPTI